MGDSHPGQGLSTCPATTTQNLSTAHGRHSFSKPMFRFSSSLARLIGALYHLDFLELFDFKMVMIQDALNKINKNDPKKALHGNNSPGGFDPCPNS